MIIRSFSLHKMPISLYYYTLVLPICVTRLINVL